MSIDFNKALVFDPKIEIVGEEVPLAAMEKTGAVLQDRYDKSYENYTKFQELAKQTEQIADPLEREKVREYIKSLEPEIQDIAKKGDFHNMRWQTMALANNAANNLKIFGERAQQIQTLKSKIAETNLNPKAREYYQNQLNKITQETTYDPERKTFNFQSIVTPNLVADYDTNKFLNQAVSNWMADKYKSNSGNMVLAKAGQSLPNGTKAIVDGVYDTKTGKLTEKVDFNEVYNNVLKMASAERGLWDMINRDVEIETEGMNLAPEQKEALKEKLTRQYLYDPLTGFSNKAAYISTVNENDIGLNVGATNAYNAGLTTNADNQGLRDVFESTINPGEKSPLISRFTANPEIKKPVSGQGNKFEFKTANDLTSAKLIFSGLSIPNLKKMQNGTPEQKQLYSELSKANVYGVYNDVMAGKPVDNNAYNNIMAILDKNNYVPPSSYKWVSTNDKKLLNELVKTDNSIITQDGRIDSDKAQQALNKRLFGDNKGLVIDKEGKFVGGNIEGLDIMDPETGKVLPFKQALESGEFGIKSSDGENTLQANGKVLPGSLAHAHSENPQQDLSYFGNGYTVNMNGKQYVVAKRGLESLNSNSAKLNDLASFSRFARDSKEYKTSDNQSVKVKSDVSGNIILEVNGVQKRPIPKEKFDAALENLGNAAAGNPKINIFDYLPQLELF